MAIYTYDDNDSGLIETIHQFDSPKTSSPSSTRISKALQFIGIGDFLQASKLLEGVSGDSTVTNIKSVLQIRVGKPADAVNLLRGQVWDPTTFMLKPEVPIHVRLNLATALFLTGHVAGCMEIVSALGKTDNEQAIELRSEVRRWEKSLSFVQWFDWKICRIEHSQGSFQTGLLPGRFGWEHRQKLAEVGTSATNSVAGENPVSQNLAC